MNSIKVFSPASVSNVCCGFDVLGFSIAGLGDELIITESDSNKVNIIKVNGYETEEERESLESWNLVAKTILHKSEWEQLFDEVGYDRDWEFFTP